MRPVLHSILSIKRYPLLKCLSQSNPRQYEMQRCLKEIVNSRYLEVVGTIFYKFKLPDAKLWLEKAIKMYFLF